MAAYDENEGLAPQLPSDVLYDDKYVRLTETHLIIKCYYFPLGTPKCIRYEDIEECVTDKEYGVTMLGTKGWGMGLSSIWWAWGGMVRNHPNLIVRVRGRWPCCGFSVENRAKVRTLLGNRGVHGCPRSEL